MISVVGNVSLFVVVLTGGRDFRTVSNSLMLNLAFADIIVSVINMPVTVVTILANEQWFNHSVCVALGFINIISFIGSVMSLALIAFNRYCFIVHWKEYASIFTRSKAVFSVVLMWLITLLIAMPPLIGWSRYSYIPGKSYCFVYWPANVYYMYFMLSICFFGPLTTMIFCYTRILRFTGAAKRKIGTNRQSVNAHAFVGGNKRHAGVLRSRLSPEEAKLTNTLLIVVSAFLISWAPFAITMFFDVYASKPIPLPIDMGSLLLGYLNSMCNPIIYAARSRRFKDEYIALFSKCFPFLKKLHMRKRNLVLVSKNVTVPSSSVKPGEEDGHTNTRSSKLAPHDNWQSNNPESCSTPL